MALVGMLATDCACNIQVLPDDKTPLYKANLTTVLDGLISGKKNLIVLNYYITIKNK